MRAPTRCGVSRRTAAPRLPAPSPPAAARPRIVDTTEASTSPLAAQVAPPPPSTTFIAANASTLRSAPLAAGAAGFLAVIINRLTASGGGGGDASFALSAASAHARADVVALALAAVLALTGLQWATLAPRAPEPVAELGGVALDWTHPALPPAAADELRWAAAAAAAATRCVSLVAFVNGVCVAHIGGGAAADAGAAGTTSKSNSTRCPSGASPGPVVDRAVETGAGTYLANLILYPGRLEFLAYLPPGAAGALVAPRGGVTLVLATDTVRGFSAVDQAWAAALAEKVDATLDGWVPR